MNESPEQTGQDSRTYLVEHYWPDLTIERLEAANAHVQAEIEAMARSGLDVRYVRTTLVPRDEAAFCFFEAASRALVEEAYARAGVQYERMSPAISIEASDTPVESPPDRKE